MIILDHAACDQWLADRGLEAMWGPEAYESGARWAIPPDANARAGLARALVEAIPPDGEVLLRVHGIIWQSSESPLLRLLRAQFGERERVLSKPGHAFDLKNRTLAESLVAVTLFSLYDAELLDGAGRFGILFHHDEFMVIRDGCACSDAINRELAEFFSPGAGQPFHRFGDLHPERPPFVPSGELSDGDSAERIAALTFLGDMLWCGHVTRLQEYMPIPRVIAVFWAEFEPTSEATFSDRSAWVVVGDCPHGYVANSNHTVKEVLQAYFSEIRAEVAAQRSGASTAHLFTNIIISLDAEENWGRLERHVMALMSLE